MLREAFSAQREPFELLRFAHNPMRIRNGRRNCGRREQNLPAKKDPEAKSRLLTDPPWPVHF